MPTIFSHAIFASSIGAAVGPEKSARFWILTSLCAMLPDADVIAFGFGIGYASVFGHRGTTHSILFAILAGGLVSTLFFWRTQVARWKLILYFAIVTFTHPLLDMLTNGGLGIAILAPFSDKRFFFPWRPVEVSPIGAGFFTERGLAVILSEMMWIWVPSLIVAGAGWRVRRKHSSSAEAHPVR